MNTVRFLGWLIGMVFSTATVAQTFEADVNEYLSANSQVSSIGLTANIKSGQLVKLLKQQLKEPLASGQSPELGFLLHADESITKEKVERILVTPFREAYDEIKRVPRTIKRTVKVGREAYKCYLKPWKWKTCWKDVFKDITETVIDEVTVRIPAVAAVYKDVVVPFIEINQSLVPIKGHFSYEVGLDDLGLDFIGNRYTVTGLFNVNVRTNVYLDNLPQAITPKGNFNSRFRIKVVQSGYLEIKPNGALQVSDPASSLDFVEAFGSGFVVDAINFGSKTLPVTGYLLDLVGKEVDNQLNKAVKKQLEEYADKINVKNYASKLIKDFDRPLKLNDNGLIYPNVTGLFISQLNGKTVNAVNQVEIKFGVTFQPFATFEVQPLPIANKDSLIQFNTDVMAGDGVNLTLPAFVTYDFIAAQLKPFVDAFNKENEDKFFVKKFMIDKVAARYAKEGNVQLSVDLLRRKKGKRIGHVSINARFFATEADTTVCAKVASVQIKSSHWLIWLFKGLLKKALIKEAEKNSCKSLAKEVIAASREIDDKMVIQTPLGTVKGQTRSLSLSDILAYTNYVLLRINMAGTVQLIDR